MPEASVRGSVIRHILSWGILLGIYAGAYYFVREFTICWRLTALPGIPSSSCQGQSVDPIKPPVIAVGQKAPTPTATPEPLVPQVEEYPVWDGASRINILFVGLRGGDPIEGDCPFCTDTLILLTVDPVTKTAGMLSIPRDMWVNIPGFGYSRINTAWTLGRGSKLPGGGPALTMKTVSHFIGVPVDYYVQVDFDTFVDIINLLGGVDIYNDETIVLDPMAHGRDFPKVRITCCGTRHLDGKLALAYARCRKESQGCGDGDVGRAKRQQKVIFAIRDKVLDPGNFAELLEQAPQLYRVFSAGIQTNMTLDDAIKLAVMVREIPENKIKNRVIDLSMMTFGSATLGGQNASVLKPLPDKVRVLRDEIFSASGPLSPMAQGDPLSLMQADGARVRLLNGTSTEQLGLRTASYFSQQGLQISEIGETKRQNRTTIVLYSPKLYTLRYLQDVFEITRSAQVLIRPDPSESVDIEVWLGEDWVPMLPTGF
ncbi:MAG TPA: LCP family protein [Anaerolineales bacterium]|nr:LCP family protein [Anaerolineales bacterium]